MSKKLTDKETNNTGFNDKQFEEVTRDVVKSLQTLFSQKDLKAASYNKNKPGLDITFTNDSAGHLYSGSEGITLTLRRPKKIEDIPYLRGQADHFTLKINHHDTMIHTSLRPKMEQQGNNKNDPSTVGNFFDFLETVRTDALGSKNMRGVAQNTAFFFQADTYELIKKRKNNKAALDTKEAEAIAYRILLRQSLIDTPLTEELHALAAPYEASFSQMINNHKHALINAINDQKIFGHVALDLLQDLFPEHDLKQPAADKNDSNNHDDNEHQNNEDDKNDAPTGDENNNEDHGQEHETDGAQEGISHIDGEEQTMDAGELGESEGMESSEEASGASQGPKNAKDLDRFEDYAIYTTEFDEIVKAEDICPPEERQRLYTKLKDDTEELRLEVRHIGQKLRRFLASQQRTTWNFDQEEGMLDTARLSRIIMSPTTPLSFKTEKENPLIDTVVTILVDNSGSMRGRPINMAATCTDILADALEQCGVKTEVLGFTTKDWKGGKAYEKWLYNEKPSAPGRLNALRHVIYKPAGMPLRRCQNNFGVMTRENLLKENIDGEALLWARERLVKRPEKRKILIVISDGAPIDDATDTINKTGFLVKHLKKTITDIEADKRIELSAIGIGHDVTRYYEKSVKIDNSQALAKTLADRLLLLFTDENDPQSRRIAKRIKMQLN